MEGVLSTPLSSVLLSELEYNAKDYLLSHGLCLFVIHVLYSAGERV